MRSIPNLGSLAIRSTLLIVARSVVAQTFVYTAGTPDGFAAPPDPTSPNVHLASLWPNTHHFDEFPPVIPGTQEVNSCLLHTFTGLPNHIVAATLEARIIGVPGALTVSDQIGLRFADAPPAASWWPISPWSCSSGYGGYGWVHQLGDSAYCTLPDPGIATPGQPWLGQDVTFTLDLDALPVLSYMGGGSTSVLQQMSQFGFLDVEIMDETAVDYLRLTVTVGSPHVASRRNSAVAPNPVAMIPFVSTPPILGATWDPAIDHTGFATGALFDLFNFGAVPLDLPGLVTWGTLLCDVGTVVLTAPGLPYPVAIPADVSLLGGALCVQGAAWDSALGLRLCDAVDVTIGLY